MIFLRTKDNSNCTYIKLQCFMKLLVDFIFFIFLLKEYSFSFTAPSINFLKNFIYLLTLLSVKYVLYTKYKKIFYLNNYNIYQIYILELSY